MLPLASATALVNLSLPVAIFTSVGVSLQGPKPPVFAAAAGSTLYAWHGGGDPAWTWVGPGDLYVDTSRHVDPSPTPEEPKIDVFVAALDAGACYAYGFAGAASTGAPAWTTPLPNCTQLAGEGIGGTYTSLQAGDSGMAVALMGYGADGGTLTARAYLLDGQTGALRWVYDLGAKEKPGQGDIAIGTGFVLFVNEDGPNGDANAAHAHVLSVADGALRAEVLMPFFIAAALSDSGDYLVVQNSTHLKGSEPWVLKWDGASYSLLHRLALPPDGTEYDVRFAARAAPCSHHPPSNHPTNTPPPTTSPPSPSRSCGTLRCPPAATPTWRSAGSRRSPPRCSSVSTPTTSPRGASSQTGTRRPTRSCKTTPPSAATANTWASPCGAATATRPPPWCSPRGATPPSSAR